MPRRGRPSAGPAQAQGCGTPAQAAAAVWENFRQVALDLGCWNRFASGPLRFASCKVPTVAADLAEGAVGLWNRIAGGGWATIGPRALGPVHEVGTVLTGTHRVLLSASPPLSRPILHLNKTGGRADAAITVCAVAEDGRETVIRSAQIDGATATAQRNFDLSGAEGQVIAVRIEADRDRVLGVADRFQWEAWVEEDPLREGPRPVKGLADLHLHQAADLAFGGLWYIGSHRQNADGALANDETFGIDDAAGAAAIARLLLPFILPPPVRDLLGHPPMSDNLHALPVNMAVGKNMTIHRNGPVGVDVPLHRDFAHLQSYKDQLKQARDEGLRLAVVSAVNNQGLCHVLRLLYPRKTRPGERQPPSCNDMDNVRLQLEALHAFDQLEDWYEIAFNPWHARRIIGEGKLAVVLSVEASNLIPPGQGAVEDQLQELYGLGVRTLQPVHETDNHFGGTAPQETMLALIQLKARTLARAPRVLAELTALTAAGVAMPVPVISALVAWLAQSPDDRERQLTEHIRGVAFGLDDSGQNRRGLTAAGRELIDQMIARAMPIDIAHMSKRMMDETLAHIRRTAGGFPVYYSHGRLEKLLDANSLLHQGEFFVFDEHLDDIVEMGGLVGLRTGFDHLLDDPLPGCRIENSCAGSSRSFAQMVTFAAKRGLPVAFGSDLSGFIHQTAPRYGPAGGPACGIARDRGLARDHPAARDEDQGERPDRRKDVPAQVDIRFSQRGLTDISLLPELYDDLLVLQKDDCGSLGGAVERLRDGAEAYLAMWEKAWDKRAKPAVARPVCARDADCGADAWCDTRGAGQAQCRARLALWEDCREGRECASGTCDRICIQPASIALGAACRVDAECRSARCSTAEWLGRHTKGECVCDDDGDCGSGNYCAEFGKNSCKAKLARYAVCTDDRQCASGECRSGLCITPASQPMGASCRLDAECRRGKCSTILTVSGVCVCEDDADCGPNQFCAKGNPVAGKDNACEPQRARGEGCTSDRQCRSGRCRLGVPPSCD